ncbi:DEAD/DEAH box helicase [Verrucosispora sioxanthis]|uniref:DEAD/DEAH box helicase n=1 Tax=Verrucosispora sioxanthis TaxID=2499994 RepID=A0A6M1L1J9_9ACTN|nr:DEAD/DEAH box helicase [Verrucosispora sioxanthis]NEE65102.1 DEAD/DEAH box helicase [Verrucosispora sioxanthis]NGM14212.1 DEAD/DEAH box helicase [Verrucosispora sioxanthis]
MNPLELADRLRDDYRRFTWTTYPVADPGLKSRLERLTDEDSLLWRGPYLSVQPRFQLDETLDELVGRIGLPPELVRAFPQVDRLFTHQVRAIERIAAGGDTLVATGTGSGKTESFLVPVVAHAYRTRHRPGVKAIALYPMNALVNDQEDRVRIACEALGLRYGVYTGATPQHKRDDMQENPPDILLTNYSMLEFILTRREDRKLFGAGVLRHLVLDEIHTYQGALGTEIACLVRRLRGHVDSEEGLVCVGLSATVSAGGDHDADLRRTATFASALFAAPLDVDGIVEETPVPAPIADSTRIGAAPDAAALRAALADGGDTQRLRALLGDPQDSPVVDLLRAELAQPRTVAELEAVLGALPQRAGVAVEDLRDEVAGWLLLGASTHTPAGPPVLEAKVHLFLRGLPRLMRCTGDREHLLLNGATVCHREGCEAQATFPLGVCLGCGQDYDLERAEPDGPVVRYLARRLHTDPVQDPDRRSPDWYPSLRCVRCGKAGNGSYCQGCGAAMRGVIVAVPEAGKELTRCPVCGYGRSAGAVEGFTARTAAAVTATAFSLHSGLAGQSDDEQLRRLLVFADSRQDTAFQAGYIRARSRAIQVRRFIVEAVRDRQHRDQPPASFNGLVEDVFRRGQAAGLYDDPVGADARQRVLRVCEWDVLGEVANDERRPPTLERLGLISVGYPGLDALTTDDLDPLFVHTGADESGARWFLARILDLARTRRAVGHDLLRARLDAKTEADLIDAGATVRVGAPVAGLGETTVKIPGTQPISMGYRSSLANMVRKVFSVSTPDAIERTIKAAVELLIQHRLLNDVQVGTGKAQVRLRQVEPQAIEVRPPSETLHRCLACRAVQPGPSPRARCSTYNCKGVVQPWDGDPSDHERQLACGDDPLVVKAEEHSGQVPLEMREQIEERFKTGDLNLLVCTMTLELGVDLGQLLAVILRNVPPRPSNYAQRAGRAGRREERVALIVTFAGTMPHDSYYYARPVEMIRGSIRPPTFLLDNARVIQRHARSLALELCGEDLPLWMRDLVSEEEAGELLNIEDVQAALSGRAEEIAARIHEVFRCGLGDDDLPWLTLPWCRQVIDGFVSDLDKAIEPYRVRQKTLLEEWQQAAAKPGREATRAITSIGASLDAMRYTDRSRAYVLSYLNSMGFLPSYAFPTDTTTLSLERESVELSHDSVQALKDYAPGQLVYARGAKWFVDEIDLRRANLVNADGAGAIPSKNICPRCDTVNDNTAASCLSCDNLNLVPQVTVPMRALRAERRQRITADEEARSRRPFEVTHHLGAPMTAETWLFERPGLLLQWERGAALTVLNRGRISQNSQPGMPPEQFLVCTGCGMWFEAQPAPKPTRAQRERFARHDKRCTNQDLKLSVLMTERKVDCLQLLPDMEAVGIPPAQLPAFLASVRASLDLGCRTVLQAGDAEVAGFDWPRPDPNSDEALMRLAVLYEEVPGGAGYLRQLAQQFGEVAATLVPVLDGCSCEQSCYACLRSYNNQVEADLLDRHVAADFLRTLAGAPDVEGRRIPVFTDGIIGLPRSPIERLLAGALINAGAPRGYAQYAWGDLGSTDGTPRPVTIADFAWPERKVTVFCDGWQHHHTPERQASDKAKRDELAAAGWTVLSFWGGEIVRDADRCAKMIIRHLRQA